MPQKKRQHYVPQFLLKNFTDNSEKFYVFQLQKNIIIDTPIPYKQQCYTDYMYGKDEQWETALSVLEADASVVVKKIIQNDCLTEFDETIIKQFILYQYLRTEQTVDSNKAVMIDGLSQLIPMIADIHKLHNVKEFARAYAKEYVNANFSRRETAAFHMEIAKGHKSALEDLRLVVLKANGSFSCSDNPVILENWLQPELGKGFECVGVILIMPISSDYALLLYDHKVYDIADENLYINLNQSDTWAINKNLFFHARKTLFCREKQTLQKIKQHFDIICIDKPLRDILSMRGTTDPIIANIIIDKLKKSNIPEITATIPKLYAHYEPLTLSILAINSQFLPFVNDINGNFSRYNKPEELAWKYSDNLAYWEVVKKYLS